MIDWMPSEKNFGPNDDTVYDFKQISKLFEVRQLHDDAWLVLNFKDHWLHFAVTEFHSSDAALSDVKVSVVFYGEGPYDVLRECRHTYWGDNGYLFYPKKKTIIKALEALSEFFDLD